MRGGFIKQSNLEELIHTNGWCNVPKSVITREGQSVDTSTLVWHLPYVIRDDTSIDFSQIVEPTIRWVTQRYVQECLQATSTHAGYASYTYIWTELIRYQREFNLVEGIQPDQLKERLVSLFEKALSDARKKHRLWAMYRPIQWYVWSAENYPELGFCPVYALELDAISVPGNPKGEAVRMEDPDRGPLHRSLEVPLLIKAMRDDKSDELVHIQEKVALALSIALGRNPANLTYLKEDDLVNLTPDSNKATWVIRVPRIKKRQLNPRDDLLDEYLDSEFAGYVLELIDANRRVADSLRVNNESYQLPRPLFINLRGNRSAVKSGLLDSYFNCTSENITRFIQQFVKRHNVISPLTKEVLRISARRLRYTLGTSLAAEGTSRKELARILDHTDTQHVQVYFELAASIVEHLDKATAKDFAKYLKLFKGKIINFDSEAVNGDREDKHVEFIDDANPNESSEIGVCGEKAICHLDPPFSCYLCEKFQPYRHADHEHVLECLLKGREERINKYSNARMGIQLDDVILAVAQVAEACRSGTGDGR